MIDNEPEQLNRPLIERIAAEASQLEVPLPGEALLSSLVAALIQIEALPLAWQAAAQIKDEQARAENLKDIVWLAPVVDQGAAVSMALQLEDDNLRQELLADAVRRLIDLGQLAGAQEVFQRLAEGGQRECIRDELLDAWLASGDYGQAQALARRGSDALRQVQELIEISQAQHRAGLLGQAGATCDLAREIADAMEPGRQQAEALAEIAAARMGFGQARAASDIVEWALTAASLISDQVAKAAASGAIAVQSAAAGISDRAEQALEATLVAIEAIEAAENQMGLFDELAQAFAEIEAPEVARQLADRALRAGENIPDESARARAFYELAIDLAEAGLAVDAWRALRASAKTEPVRLAAFWAADQIIKMRLDEFRREGDPAGAIALVQELDEPLSKAWVVEQIVTYYLDAGYAGVAQQALEKVDGQGLDNYVLARLAEAQMESGRFEAARAAAEPIQEARLRDATLGKIALAQGNSGDADGALQTALLIADEFEFVSQLQDILYGLFVDQGPAAVLETAARFDEPLIMDYARDIIVQASVEQGDLDDAQEMAGQIQDAWLSDQAHKDAAQARRQAGQWPQALAAAQRVSDLNERAEALAQIGLAQTEAGDREDAAQSLALGLDAAAAIRDADDRLRLLLQMAAQWQAAGQTRPARDALALALQPVASLDDSLPRALALTGIARAQAQAGAVAAAADTLLAARGLATAAEEVGEQDQPLYQIMLAQAEIGQFQAARQTAAAMQDDQTFVLSLTEIAVGLAQQGRYADALQVVELIGSKGHRSRARQSIARLQAEAGDFVAARATINLIESDLNKRVAKEELAALQAPAGSSSEPGRSATDAAELDDLPPERLATRLLDRGLAQARAGQDLAAQETMAASRVAAGQIADPESRAKSLRAVIAAAGQFGYGDEVLAGYQSALAAAGPLDDGDLRRRLQGDIALALAGVGRGDRAVDIAEQHPDSQAGFLPELALILAKSGDDRSLQRLWPLCAYDPGLALRSCAAIAHLDPAQAAAVAEIVINHSWS
jgi:hypothetical protein